MTYTLFLFDVLFYTISHKTGGVRHGLVGVMFPLHFVLTSFRGVVVSIYRGFFHIEYHPFSNIDSDVIVLLSTTLVVHVVSIAHATRVPTFWHTCDILDNYLFNYLPYIM